MDYIRKAFADTRSAALTLGLGTVLATNAGMLVFPLPDDPDKADEHIRYHAALNLLAAGSVAYGARLL